MLNQTDAANGLKAIKTSRNYVQSVRLFYVIAACISLAVSLTGFRNFYLAGRGFGGNPLTHQIVPLIFVHAFAMSCWPILLLVQSVLVYNGKLRIHMTLGLIGAFLAGAIVILGFAMGIFSTHFNPMAYRMFGGGKFFLIEMLTEIVLFGILVAIAIIYRRRAEIHRPAILVATVVIMSGALARCPVIDDLAAIAPLYAYGPVMLFGMLLIPIYWLVTKTVDRWYNIMLTGVGIVFLISVPLGHSTPWRSLLGNFIQ